LSDYFHRVSAQTATRFWINNATLEEVAKAIEAGAVGCTQNPAYTWKILNGSTDQAAAERLLDKILKEEPDDEESLVILQRELVAGVAKLFLPMYEATKGQTGYVSIQGSPIHEDTETIIRHARKNAALQANIMAKIPVTIEGLAAIKVLAAEGVPINATECMAVRQVLDVCEVYKEAIKGISKPAPLYFSLITGIYDEYIQKYVKDNKIDISKDVLWQAGISVARKVHALVQERDYPCGFIGGGARGLHHFTEMIGANASITINWEGTADKLLEQDMPVISRFPTQTPYSVEDELLEKLPEHRKAFFIHGIEPHEYEEYGPVVLFRNNFVTAWTKALEYIKNRR
jgi:transaldolase